MCWQLTRNISVDRATSLKFADWLAHLDANKMHTTRLYMTVYNAHDITLLLLLLLTAARLFSNLFFLWRGGGGEIIDQSNQKKSLQSESASWKAANIRCECLYILLHGRSQESIKKALGSLVFWGFQYCFGRCRYVGCCFITAPKMRLIDPKEAWCLAGGCYKLLRNTLFRGRGSLSCLTQAKLLVYPCAIFGAYCTALSLWILSPLFLRMHQLQNSHGVSSRIRQNLQISVAKSVHLRKCKCQRRGVE